MHAMRHSQEKELHLTYNRVCAMQAWGDADVLTRLPTPQQAYMTRALVLMLQRLGKAGIEAAPGLLPALLSGVGARLDSPLDAVR